MLKKVQLKLHKCLCVLACFSVTSSVQLPSLTTSDSYVITSNRAAVRFEGSTGMGSFVQNACDLAITR
jgi:2-methylaconitate cis-trans-isomerase PrpF